MHIPRKRHHHRNVGRQVALSGMLDSLEKLDLFAFNGWERGGANPAVTFDPKLGVLPKKQMRDDSDDSQCWGSF